MAGIYCRFLKFERFWSYNSFKKQIKSIMELQKFESQSEIKPFETKYPCIICIERVKMPVKCSRCKSIICYNHVKKIEDRCPYCRLSPFIYERQKFLDEIVNLDKKKEQEYLIETSAFKCLVEGCDFTGKYHKMDLHRRKFHRNETLREIIFPQERQNGKKLRAVELLLNRLKEKSELNGRAYQIGLILHNRSRNRIDLKQLVEMVRHVDYCGHAECEQVHVQESMCFIGNRNKEISGCMQSQKFLTFY